jgi:hypothetical protein
VSGLGVSRHQLLHDGDAGSVRVAKIDQRSSQEALEMAGAWRSADDETAVRRAPYGFEAFGEALPVRPAEIASQLLPSLGDQRDVFPTRLITA